MFGLRVNSYWCSVDGCPQGMPFESYEIRFWQWRMVGECLTVCLSRSRNTPSVLLDHIYIACRSFGRTPHRAPASTICIFVQQTCICWKLPATYLGLNIVCCSLIPSACRICDSAPITQLHVAACGLSLNEPILMDAASPVDSSRLLVKSVTQQLDSLEPNSYTVCLVWSLTLSLQYMALGPI